MTETLTKTMLDEQEVYEQIRCLLEVSGEYPDSQLDAATCYIIDNPSIFPEYFNCLIS